MKRILAGLFALALSATAYAEICIFGVCIDTPTFTLGTEAVWNVNCPSVGALVQDDQGLFEVGTSGTYKVNVSNYPDWTKVAIDSVTVYGADGSVTPIGGTWTTFHRMGNWPTTKTANFDLVPGLYAVVVTLQCGAVGTVQYATD